MTTIQPEVLRNMPTDGQFYSESLHAIEVCKAYCNCHDYWHFLWAGMKAAGLRRGIYLQKNLFDALLANRRSIPQRVLIAGSADAAALHILHQTLNGNANTYHAIDHCQSPLQLLAEYAQAEKIDLTTEISDIQSSPSGPWDIVLVHNTLIFLTSEQRIQTLRGIAKHLNRDGLILCGMRYNNAMQISAADLKRECERTSMILSRTYAKHSAILNLLQPMIEPYVQAQLASLACRPDRSHFYAELNTAGLQIVESYPDQQVLPSVASDLNQSLNIEAELMLLQVA